uniref:Integrase zinc-binding domain-containing protein n=1 Tax=Rhizophora mucronata TaxID=61149 RepID=A0A2P2Q7U9_RHIMU
MQEYHASLTVNHSGFLRTYKYVGKEFYWKGMKKKIRRFVTECDVYQRYKSESVAFPGLLQPLPIPKEVSTDISMNFIEGLPLSQGKPTC